MSCLFLQGWECYPDRSLPVRVNGTLTYEVEEARLGGCESGGRNRLAVGCPVICRTPSHSTRVVSVVQAIAFGTTDAPGQPVATQARRSSV